MLEVLIEDECFLTHGLARIYRTLFESTMPV